MNVRCAHCIAYSRRSSLICRQRQQDLLELSPLALPELVALDQTIELGSSQSGKSLSFHVKHGVAGSQASGGSSSAPSPRALLLQRRNHQIPLGFIALAVGAHVPALAQVLVYHPAL